MHSDVAVMSENTFKTASYETIFKSTGRRAKLYTTGKVVD